MKIQTQDFRIPDTWKVDFIGSQKIFKNNSDKNQTNLTQLFREIDCIMIFGYGHSIDVVNFKYSSWSNKFATLDPNLGQAFHVSNNVLLALYIFWYLRFPIQTFDTEQLKTVLLSDRESSVKGFMPSQFIFKKWKAHCLKKKIIKSFLKPL